VSASSSPLGLGLYFIDVLACLLFCITLALVGARFGRETTVPVELPRIDAPESAGAGLEGTDVVVRNRDGVTEFFLGDEPVDFATLEARLRAAPPLSIVVRAEASAVARVIGAAHAAGVHDIQLAYEAEGAGRGARGGR
jgi:biopolymer transport protein ExbD